MTTPVSGLSWNDFATQLGVLAVEPTQTVASVVTGVSDYFTTYLPQACQYAENRICRDFPWLAFQVENTGYSLTTGNNKLTLANADFTTVQTIMVNGAPLLPVSKEWLQSTYGSAGTLAQPTCFAMYGGDAATSGRTSMIVTLGPWPDQNYPATIVGTSRPPSLYTYATTADAATVKTWISTWLPDLMLAAAMIFVSAEQRQFAATADQPEIGINWETTYGKLMAGAQVEEARKRFEASAWSSQAPAPVASPGR